jgi:ABC-type transport system involved in multi-copper enzyme maturation permease subunit
MRSLLWKEWHEQSWKLAFGCIVLGMLAYIGLHARIVADETMMMWVCFLGLTMLPVLSSTGLVPAERGEGTLESLLALPVAPRKILKAKVCMGVLLCVGPMFVAMILSLLAAAGREMTAMSMIAFYAASTMTTLSLFAWMAALTIRLPSETRAALLSVGILIMWMLITEGLAFPSVPALAMVVSPFGIVHGTADNSALIQASRFLAIEAGSAYSQGITRLILFLVVQAAIAGLLWGYASRRLAD